MAAALDDRGMPWGGRGDVDDRCIFYFSIILREMTCKKEKEKKTMKKEIASFKWSRVS